MHTITSEEHHTIIAGLRLLQLAIIDGTVPSGIKNVATNSDNHPMPTPDQIEDLCAILNTGSYHSD